jgi:YesN/AraC family two-component response regulator
MLCVGMAGDGEEAVKWVKDLLPDVVILDIAMPKMNGIEAGKRIKSTYPATAIIIVSAYNYDQYVLSCIQLGVDGYLLKTT